MQGKIYVTDIRGHIPSCAILNYCEAILRNRDEVKWWIGDKLGVVVAKEKKHFM